MLFESEVNEFSLSVVRRRAHAIDFCLTAHSLVISSSAIQILLDVYETIAAHACNCSGEKTFGQVVAAGSVDLGHVLEHLTIDLLVRTYGRMYDAQNSPVFAGTTSSIDRAHNSQRIIISYVSGQAALVYEAMRTACQIMDSVLSGENLSLPDKMIAPLVTLLADESVCRR